MSGSTTAVVLPSTVVEACEMLAADPERLVLAGGTDLMVEVNFGHRRPMSVLSLHKVDELRAWHREGDELVIGAGVTYAEMESASFALLAPALAQAARTVGSPQIRNAGTIGGNVATASPAGDTLPVLAALDATFVLRSVRETRNVSWRDFFTGPKRSVRRADELLTEVRVPVARGRQEYLKVGTRNAMVIAVASVALIVDTPARAVRCAMGSVGPVPLRAEAAEQWVAGQIDWSSMQARSDDVAVHFANLVAESSRPIDDHRSTASYRRHAVGVCARRALERVLA